MTLYQEIASHKFRTLKSFIFCLGYMSLGLCAAMKGPALLDMQLMTSSTIEEITQILPADALGFVAGAILCAATITYIDSQLFIISGLFCLGVVAIAIPYFNSALYLCIDSVFFGFFSGFIHTAGNVWLQGLWAKAAPPFLQALHFCFGLGAFCGPLIVRPFLLPLQTDDEKNATLNITGYSKVSYTPGDVKLKLPYLVGGAFNLITAIAFGIVFFCKRNDSPHPSMKWTDQEVKQTHRTPSSLTKFAIVLASCFFMFFQFALELGSGYLLVTYAVKCQLHLTKATASMMTSAFWAFFTFFRCTTVFIVDIVGCQNVVTVDMVLIMTANVLLLTLSRTHVWALWLGVSLMGCGMSSVFAAMLGFLADIIQVTSKITSLLMVSCALGNFIIPHIVGKYIDTFPEVFLILNGIAGLGCTLLFGFLVIIQYHLKIKKK